MQRLTPTSMRLMLCAFLVAIVTPCQDVRELAVPTGQQQFFNATTATIANAAGNGYRLVDLEYRSGSGGGTRFNATMVQNTGAYSSGWWWYYDITAVQLNSAVAANNGRLIDLESYVDANGNQRFACVMVPNTGAQAKAWWYYYDTTAANLNQQAIANNARLVDIDAYQVGGTTYYLGVMIRNVGADARAWWWYTGRSTAQVASLVNSNQARLYDLDRNPNGTWDCAMLRDAVPVNWHYWTNLTASDVGYLINNYGVRPIDIEMFTVGFFVRYSMVTINNVNALTTAVGNSMRATTNGQVGCWLEQINGPNLANLNGTTAFEPASTMKTLHHVHAMRRVALGAASLQTPLNVFTNYSQTNASCPIDSGAVTETLGVVLRDMMENSDNARTQAVTAYFGESAINATAAALGMASTSLNHRLGCGVEALADPNQTSLRDLHQLHEQVANGYLGNDRNAFYDQMLNSPWDLSIGAMINQEAGALGLTSATAQMIRGFTKLAHKGGSYGLGNGGPLYYHRAEFGWLSLPFLVNGAIAPREYGFGLFVNNASNDSLASTAIYTNGVRELLRPTIRAALQTWAANLATTQSVGSGCGAPTFSQSVGGLPRLGATPSYSAQNGYPNALAAFVLGTSSTWWDGTPLPVSLASIGGEAGCFAYNDAVGVQLFVANNGGGGVSTFTVPNNFTLLGLEYLSQFWSFDAGILKTTNGYRNTVGL